MKLRRIIAARVRGDRLVELQRDLAAAQEWCDRLAKVAQDANRQAMDASRERDAAKAWAGRWKRLATRLREEAASWQHLWQDARNELFAAQCEAARLDQALADTRAALTLAVRERDAAREALRACGRAEA